MARKIILNYFIIYQTPRFLFLLLHLRLKIRVLENDANDADSNINNERQSG